MAQAIFKLLPIFHDDPAQDTLSIVDDSPIECDTTILGDFDPADMSTRRWQARRLAPQWVPREIVGPDEQRDYHALGLAVPMFNRRAVDALRGFLEPNGELLPLMCKRGQYYAYNVTTVADVLDLERSEVKWPSWYRLRKLAPVLAQEITHYEFKEALLPDLSVFRIPERVVEYYVTDRFADRVVQLGLRGFDLRKVWPLPRARPGRFAEMERRFAEVRGSKSQ
jgi:hypothetical protein